MPMTTDARAQAPASTPLPAGAALADTAPVDTALPADTDAVIRVRGLRKAFGDVTVLDGVDLDVAAGSVHALLGPNGAGKTTLVRILATLLRADAGSASVAGHDVGRSPRRVREVISLTGQHAAVDELLTGEENLLLAARLFRLPRGVARRRVGELVDAFDLGGFAGRLVRTYSGGMRRRLDIAVGLVAHPQVVFLDEPTTGLDPRSRQGVWEIVGRLAEDGTTVLLTTQYLEEADRLADLVSVLDGGRVIARGTPDELKARLGSERAELTFPDDAAYARAVAALGAAPAAEIAGPAGGGTAGGGTAGGLDTDPAARRVGVPTDGTATAVRRLLADLDDRGIDVARVELRRPTLDDVFLSLTGGPARAAD
ncbi:ATP-binding cassette domain-containing protein [Frankia sp. CNm7]|uniref:ATP-binding cassette domain-containing protein n=1 Tax=Frankia nepalensis TaxID=1836974 RepID=A0A937RM67_9ACTN|nr:ATP-binding cassette domain-containing protein [Frankia nepalensis]MBL7501177.1 ATP-binding cassette domain-containing protein [Frankia nepalensis]MBL7512621.1 ATP-binding cassette domain-containing protein [Frankia nepalensis]MBL7519681.1 ATP-binding cassette domain-containing protein [Frankia nepalensis]MBL7632677.1 ATP-binding cassette domain-containing protein [Frankia nepalensis]